MAAKAFAIGASRLRISESGAWAATLRAMAGQLIGPDTLDISTRIAGRISQSISWLNTASVPVSSTKLMKRESLRPVHWWTTHHRRAFLGSALGGVEGASAARAALTTAG